jgi:ribonuclease HI
LSPSTTIIIHTDGAARGNPGPAAIGVTLHDGEGTLLATVSERLGVATNNVAEYRAVIAGLQKAIQLGAREVKLVSDSELVVRQIKGRYKVKNAALRLLYSEVVKLAGKLDKFTARSVPRGRNAAADGLANKALDGR